MSDVLEDAEDAGGDGNATRRVVALRDELLHQAGAFLAANGSVTVSSPAIVVSVQVAAAGEPAAVRVADGYAVALPGEALAGDAAVRIRATLWRRVFRRGGVADGFALVADELEVEVWDAGPVAVSASRRRSCSLPAAGGSDRRCVYWDGAWTEANVTLVGGTNGSAVCASTHLSSFSVAAPPLTRRQRSLCGDLRGAGALSSGAYFLLLLFSVQFYLVVGYYAVCEGDRQLRAARRRGGGPPGGRGVVPAVPAGMVALSLSLLAGLRAAYFLRAVAFTARDRVACLELADAAMHALHDAGTPALLLALSAIVVSWYQILEERAKARGLTGRCLAALLAANGFYALCALGLSAAAAPGSVASDDRDAVARAHLAFFAGACVSQGCAYVHLGLRLGRRLDALGQADERVARLKRRVRTLLRTTGSGAVALGALAAAGAAATDLGPRAAFYLFHVAMRIAEVVVVGVTCRQSLRPRDDAAARESDDFFPLTWARLLRFSDYVRHSADDGKHAFRLSDLVLPPEPAGGSDGVELGEVANPLPGRGDPFDEGDVYGAREEQPVVIVNPTAPRAGGDEGPAFGDEGDVYGAKDDDVVVVANPASRHAADADDGPDLGDEGDVYGGDEKEDVVVVDNPAARHSRGGDDDVDVDLGDVYDDPGDAVAGASSLARESHANA
ncbi:hypothetical protein JL720_14153 [Aureococcus anophagefferens]|nr:hypothetical protein JL720_14153 [Aureococcus anophagefferens]